MLMHINLETTGGCFLLMDSSGIVAVAVGTFAEQSGLIRIPQPSPQQHHVPVSLLINPRQCCRVTWKASESFKPYGFSLLLLPLALVSLCKCLGKQANVFHLSSNLRTHSDQIGTSYQSERIWSNSFRCVQVIFVLSFQAAKAYLDVN